MCLCTCDEEPLLRLPCVEQPFFLWFSATLFSCWIEFHYFSHFSATQNVFTSWIVTEEENLWYRWWWWRWWWCRCLTSPKHSVQLCSQAMRSFQRRRKWNGIAGQEVLLSCPPWWFFSCLFFDSCHAVWTVTWHTELNKKYTSWVVPPKCDEFLMPQVVETKLYKFNQNVMKFTPFLNAMSWDCCPMNVDQRHVELRRWGQAFC